MSPKPKAYSCLFGCSILLVTCTSGDMHVSGAEQGAVAYLGLKQEVIPFTDCPGSLFDLKAALMGLYTLLGLPYSVIQDLNPLHLVQSLCCEDIQGGSNKLHLHWALLIACSSSCSHSFLHPTACPSDPVLPFEQRYCPTRQATSHSRLTVQLLGGRTSS